LINGDIIAGALSRVAGDTVGTYTIEQGDLSAGNNYSITFVSGKQFEIAKGTPTVAHLEYDLSTICLGSALPTVTLNSSYSGMGDITVKYNGNATPPTNAGTYAVTVEIAAGTNFNSTVSDLSLGSLTINPLPTATLTSSCTITLGDSVDMITFTGASPWDITYNDGTTDQTLTGITSSPYWFKPTATGVYMFNLISVSDANCQNSVNGTVEITVQPVASNDASLASLTVSEGTLTPVFHSETLTYTVEVPNSVDSITVSAQATDANATVEGTGKFALSTGENPFSIKVTSEDKAVEQTYTVTVTRNSVGLTSVENVGINVSVYPNPIRDILHIVSDLHINQIDIYDANGKMVQQITNPTTSSFSTTEWSTGIYLLKIHTDKGITVKKIVKR
jgi:hypothetical protein